MKEAIAILTGGGPAPGMNTVVGSVAKTFLAKGYRVIGLHYGYSGLFNSNPRYEDMDFVKADCIMTDEGASYVVLVDSDTLGIGTLMLRLTVYIPDTDYQSGTRKEVIKINPHIRITG